MTDVSEARTLWEEGHEPGRQVVALGFALALSAVVIDGALGQGIGLLFDLVFVVACVVVALLVRPQDFFTVGVLPPLMMLAVMILLALWRPTALGASDLGLVRLVLSGLAQHAVALAVGYAACLACLAIRDRFINPRSSTRPLTGH